MAFAPPQPRFSVRCPLPHTLSPSPDPTRHRRCQVCLCGQPHIVSDRHYLLICCSSPMFWHPQPLAFAPRRLSQAPVGAPARREGSVPHALWDVHDVFCRAFPRKEFGVRHAEEATDLFALREEGAAGAPASAPGVDSPASARGTPDADAAAARQRAHRVALLVYAGHLDHHQRRAAAHLLSSCLGIPRSPASPHPPKALLNRSREVAAGAVKDGSGYRAVWGVFGGQESSW